VLKLPPEKVIRLKEMVPTIRELRIIDMMRDYRAVRDRYFGETIPPVEKVAFLFLDKTGMEQLGDYDDLLGVCWHRHNRHWSAPVVFGLWEDNGESQMRITLIHEMAHAKVNREHKRDMGHGKYWKNEMKRLAKVGAFDDWW
jgi:hypothetical protein